MRIALVNSTPKAKVYPLGLMKISAMLKSWGHTVKLFSCLLPEPKKYDEIWISTLFTFDIPIALALVREAKRRAKVVKVGGIAASLMPEVFRKEGVQVHIGQISEAEKMAPDYDLLETDPEYSIAHTSRGCIRKCGFCMVHRLEPEFKKRDDWEKDLCPKTTKVRFFDNNWTAKSIPDLKADVILIKRLIAEGKITEMDFNQAIDCRIMTEEKADIIQGLPIKPLRFAFDGMHEDKFFQKAVQICIDRGFKEFSAYLLYNFKDTPEDFYYRMRECVRFRETNSKIEVQGFPMKYQPILDLQSYKFVGDHWTKKSLDGFKQILNQHSVYGQLSTKGKMNEDKTWKLSPIAEFEYWFGKDKKEFVNLINYPGIKLLSQRKKGSLREWRFKDNG